MIIDMRAISEKLRQFEFDCPHKIDLWEKYEEVENPWSLEDKMIAWCKENIKDRCMYRHNWVFIFASEQDAAAFKLTWS